MENPTPANKCNKPTLPHMKQDQGQRQRDSRNLRRAHLKTSQKKGNEPKQQHSNINLCNSLLDHAINMILTLIIFLFVNHLLRNTEEGTLRLPTILYLPLLFFMTAQPPNPNPPESPLIFTGKGNQSQSSRIKQREGNTTQEKKESINPKTTAEKKGISQAPSLLDQMDELEQAPYKANPYTSPGESGIPTEIPKLVPISYSTPPS